MASVLFWAVVFPLFIVPLSAYFSVKLGTGAYLRARFLFTTQQESRKDQTNNGNETRQRKAGC